MSCKAAKPTDEWHGWECEISGGECMFQIPSSRACADRYGEGPDAVNESQSEQKQKGPQALQSQTDHMKIISRVIITRRDNDENWADGFIGSVGDFKHYLKAKRRELKAGIIVP